MRTEEIRSSFFIPIHRALFVPTLNSRKIILHFQYSSESSNKKTWHLAMRIQNWRATAVSRKQNCILRGLGRSINKQKPGISVRVEMPGFVPLYIRRHCLLLLYQTLITWMISALALESDSMRSRSSLLRGRTAFSIYRFDNRDRAFVIALFSCITLTAMGVILGASQM